MLERAGEGTSKKVVSVLEMTNKIEILALCCFKRKGELGEG